MEPPNLENLDWDHAPTCELSHGKRHPFGMRVTGPCDAPAGHYNHLVCPRSHTDRWLYVCADHHQRLVLDAPDIVCSCGQPIRVTESRPL